ncbi:DUF2490 domain-containing protein [Candidatus Omnitrophota bacterium]
MKFFYISIILLICFTDLRFAFGEDDFQYWNTENASWQLADNWKIQLEAEFRFGDDACDFYYQHSDSGATFSGLAEWLDIGFNYRQIFEEKNSDWKYENRPHLNATVKFNLGGLKLSNRGRLAYRNREDADNFWQYRNKLTLKFPNKLSKLDIQPYLADEIFVSFDDQELNRNRLYVGFYLKLLKSLKGEIFYLWQRSKSSGKWTNANILGTKLKFSF